MITGSPGGICQDCIVEIKYPVSAKTFQNFINNGQPAQKYIAQMQLQMYLTGLHKGYFCVADCNYSSNKKVEIVFITCDQKYLFDFLNI